MTAAADTARPSRIATDASGAVTTVRVPAAARVRVIADPFTAVLAVGCAGIRDHAANRPTPAARVTRKLGHESYRALARVAAPGSSLAPDCLSPLRFESRTIAEDLEHLRALGVDDLNDDLDRTFGGAPPRHWHAVARDPLRWVRDITDALEALWNDVEPAWNRQAQQRDYEATRIGYAAVKGALDPLVKDWHPRGWNQDGHLCFPDPDGTTYDKTAETIVLAPLLSRIDTSISNLDRPDVLQLAYPLPVRDDGADPRSFTALLTPVRARIVALVTRPRSMSYLARSVNISAANATYQVDQLVLVGLVTKTRHGRQTLVQRTNRGDQLLELYGLTDAEFRGSR